MGGNYNTEHNQWLPLKVTVLSSWTWGDIPETGPFPTAPGEPQGEGPEHLCPDKCQPKPSSPADIQQEGPSHSGDIGPPTSGRAFLPLGQRISYTCQDILDDSAWPEPRVVFPKSSPGWVRPGPNEFLFLPGSGQPESVCMQLACRTSCIAASHFLHTT